jgi:putative hydrolase of the HAD superfamily
MLPKAILFDMDETLLTNTMPIESAWQEACETSAKRVNTFNSEELRLQINIIREWYWGDPERHRLGRLNLLKARTAVVRLSLEKLGCGDEVIAAAVATDYSSLIDRSLSCFPNAEDTLLQLVKKGVKLALLTNGAGESQQEKIKRFGFSRYFPVRLIEGELGFGKPDQRVFETAMKKLETTPGQTWMVGDDLQRDIAGAQKMGIYSIWCDYGRNGLPESSKVKPDKIINNIAELLSL